MSFPYPSYHSHGGCVFLVRGAWKAFGHNVGDHIRTGAVFKINPLCQNEFTNEVMLNVDMFGVGMIFWVTS